MKSGVMRKTTLFIGLMLCMGYLKSQSFVPPVNTARSRIFDDNWFFYKSHERCVPLDSITDWQSVHLPHDWSLEDLPETEFVPDLPVIEGEWAFAEGDSMQWAEAEYDDSAWETVSLPARWNDHSDYQGEYNFGWYRKEIEIPDSLGNRPFDLNLGFIDDCDEVYLNGRLIGKSGLFCTEKELGLSAYDQPRYYRIEPEYLVAGKNLVAIRVCNLKGSGGIWKQGNRKFPNIGPFTCMSPGSVNTGYTLGGYGWYKKTFELDESKKHKRFYIRFDGVYMDSEVWINGHYLGCNPYGYSPFSYELTPYVRFGKDNTIVVKVVNTDNSSRWYSGSGIYRHVWLEEKNTVSFKDNSLYVKTRLDDYGKATVSVDVVIEGTDIMAQKDKECFLHLYDGANREIVAEKRIIHSNAAGLDSLNFCFRISKPHLWSTENPYLYRLVLSTETDTLVNNIGIRQIEYSAQKGFVLNGNPLKLYGGCIHHDNGILGAAAYDRAEIRKVELLKQRGYNALRLSHNPFSTQFMDACDRLGMLVIVELFDTWTTMKTPGDYALYFNRYWEEDTERIICRDRNRPSVIMWSMGNEIHERADSVGVEIAMKIRKKILCLDDTRPITQAVPGFWYDDAKQWDDNVPAFITSDIKGYNYQYEEYTNDHVKHPEWLMMGTESYPGKMYDIWQLVNQNTYVIGDFVWTAMDYLGETGVGHAILDNMESTQNLAWPWVNANCGDLDINGQQKAQSYYRDVLWNMRNLTVMVQQPIPEGRKEIISKWGWRNELPSWDWHGFEGHDMTVNVYSNYPKVELFLNGETLGVKDVTDRKTATYTVPYGVGKLEAKGMDENGKVVEKTLLETPCGKFVLSLEADRKVITNNYNDLTFVTVSLMDKAGNLVCSSADKVRFEVEGAGRILASGNSAPNQPASYRKQQCNLFRGRCLVVLQPLSEGIIKLKAIIADKEYCLKIKVKNR